MANQIREPHIKVSNIDGSANIRGTPGGGSGNILPNNDEGD